MIWQLIHHSMVNSLGIHRTMNGAKEKTWEGKLRAIIEFLAFKNTFLINVKITYVLREHFRNALPFLYIYLALTLQYGHRYP